jgi:hypothetical protein
LTTLHIAAFERLTPERLARKEAALTRELAALKKATRKAAKH